MLQDIYLETKKKKRNESDDNKLQNISMKTNTSK